MRVTSKLTGCLLLALTLLCVASCTGYSPKNLVKSDTNLVTDEFIAETRGLVRELLIKLYKRNPGELRRGDGSTVLDRFTLLRETRGKLEFDELEGALELDALELVFDENFDGDRVFALCVGLGGMLRHAYGYDDESFLFDKLDPVALETSARNIEILLWRLKNEQNANGQAFLVTHKYQGQVDNLSFERLFGKLIALQDMMASIAGDANDRRMTKAVHTATSVFIPLPI